jgi:hypothetical protein
MTCAGTIARRRSAIRSRTSGYLSKRRWGRVVLWIVGLGFAALIAFGIYRS